MSSVFESPELVANVASVGAAGGGGVEGGGAGGNGAAAALPQHQQQQQQQQQRDFAFPSVEDAEEPWVFSSAAAAAFDRLAPPSLPRPLPVMCARDFLRVIVQPAEGKKWGMCGPLAGGGSGGVGGKGEV